jgi:hypothetical protein
MLRSSALRNETLAIKKLQYVIKTTCGAALLSLLLQKVLQQLLVIATSHKTHTF